VDARPRLWRDCNNWAIALWQMEGCTVEEIAERLGRSPRTVARKLVLIRDLWRREGDAS